MPNVQSKPLFLPERCREECTLVAEKEWWCRVTGALACDVHSWSCLSPLASLKYFPRQINSRISQEGHEFIPAFSPAHVAWQHMTVNHELARQCYRTLVLGTCPLCVPHAALCCPTIRSITLPLFLCSRNRKCALLKTSFAAKAVFTFPAPGFST